MGQCDKVYQERNICVALIAKMAIMRGWTAGLGKHVGDDWEDDWRNIVFIDLPSGQVSWHIHNSDMPLFSFLPTYLTPWDGHDYDQKYRRVLVMTIFQEGAKVWQ